MARELRVGTRVRLVDEPMKRGRVTYILGRSAVVILDGGSFGRHYRLEDLEPESRRTTS
jgi:hypothetical protein